MKRSAAVLVALSSAGGALAQVGIAVPVRFLERVTPVLARSFGDEVSVLAAASVADVPVGDIHLLFDEWSLRRVGAAAELVWVDDYGVALDRAFPEDGGGDHAWEALALHPVLDGRLGIVDPLADGSPWLLAMREVLPRRGPDGVIALWTTLDARAGRLRGGNDELLADLRGGSLTAAIGPVALLAPVVAASAGRLRLERLRGTTRGPLGMVLARNARSDAEAIFARLREPGLRDELAEAAGITVAESEPSLSEAAADSWWSQFAQHVRGRGRQVERLADGLDYVFVLAFLVCAWLLWRSLRRESSMADHGASGNVP